MGIIGGADGPTVVFVTGDFGGAVAFALGLALAAGLIVFFAAKKRKKKTDLRRESQ